MKGKGTEVVELFHDNELSAEITVESKVVPIQLPPLNDSFAGVAGSIQKSNKDSKKQSVDASPNIQTLKSKGTTLNGGDFSSQLKSKTTNA